MKAFLSEIVDWYKVLKKIVIDLFDVFKSPPIIGYNTTVITNPKFSWKRISAAIVLVIAIRQFVVAPNDRFGILVLFGYVVIVTVVAAITKS